MIVMKAKHKENTSLLFNIVTLLGFLLGLFLIIFLKREEGNKSEQLGFKPKSEKSRVKLPTHSSPTEKQLQRERGLSKARENLNERQRHILDRLEQEREMEPKEIYNLIPEVSTRTARRDMDILVKNNLVVQRGSTKATTYIYVG